MRNYTQEQKLQLQTLISQEAMLPAKLFKYLRSEEHLPSLLALVDVPGFSEPLMCSVPANQVDRLNKPVSIRDLQPGFRVVLGGLEEDGSLTASRRRAQELIYDRLFLHPDRRQVYQGRVMGISPQGLLSDGGGSARHPPPGVLPPHRGAGGLRGRPAPCLFRQLLSPSAALVPLPSG